ncbi:hypothetical protein L195_g044180, partial [Trifolium pratense]
PLLPFSNLERGARDNKLATRGSNSFKSKPGGVVSKEVVKNNVNQLFEAHTQRPNGTEQGGRLEKNEGVEVVQIGSIEGVKDAAQSLDQPILQQVVQPNMARPPNWTAPSINKSSSSQQNKVVLVDNEAFVDASEYGSVGSVDSDMEIVEETPSLTQ